MSGSPGGNLSARTHPRFAPGGFCFCGGEPRGSEKTPASFEGEKINTGPGRPSAGAFRRLELWQLRCGIAANPCPGSSPQTYSCCEHLNRRYSGSTLSNSPRLFFVRNVCCQLYPKMYANQLIQAFVAANQLSRFMRTKQRDACVYRKPYPS